MKNKKIIIAISIIITVGICFLLFFSILKPYYKVVKDYNKVADVVKSKNNEVNKLINKLQKLIDSDAKVIDENVIANAKAAKKKAQSSMVLLDSRPFSKKEMQEKTKKLSTPPDYTDIIKELNDAYDAYDLSIKMYKQMTNPKEEFIIQRLQRVDEITDVSAVTEDNDPNGHLNKPGGYTATVYFSSSNVNQYEIYGNTLIEKGTDAGGAIEVYANENDAIKRRDYLAGFDGGVLSSGSHTVVGTVLIRTSDELTATQQKNLEKKIIDALTYIEGSKKEEPEKNEQEVKPNTPDNEVDTPIYTPEIDNPSVNDSQIYSVVGTYQGPDGTVVTFNQDGTLFISSLSKGDLYHQDGSPALFYGSWSQNGNTFSASFTDELNTTWAPQSSVVYASGIYWWSEFYTKIG